MSNAEDNQVLTLRENGETIIDAIEGGQNLSSYGCAMLECILTGLPEFPKEWAYYPPSLGGRALPKHMEYGILTHHHATIKWGFVPSQSYQAILDIVRAYEKYNGRLYSQTKFGIDDFGIPGEAVCLVLRFESEWLTGLNQVLTNLFWCSKNDWPEYKPHITVGYFKPEFADQAEELLAAAVDDGKITAYFLNAVVED